MNPFVITAHFIPELFHCVIVFPDNRSRCLCTQDRKFNSGCAGKHQTIHEATVSNKPVKQLSFLYLMPVFQSQATKYK